MYKKVVGTIAVVIVVVVGVFVLSGNDGSTVEKREKMLNDKKSGYSISNETEFEGYIISNYYGNGENGIAIFEPKDNGKYSLQSTYYRGDDEIILAQMYANENWYNIASCSVPDIVSAKMTFTYDTGETKVYEMEAETEKAVIVPDEFKNYTLEAVFYDSKGNEIK